MSTSNSTPTYRLTTLKSGRFAVVSPYSALFVEEAKRRMGEWKKVTLSGTPTDCWVFDPSHREAIEALLAELFPARDQLVERTLHLSAGAGSPTIDGYDLLSLRRDDHRPRHHDAGVPVQVLEIIEDGLTDVGSVKYPRVIGHIVLRVRCRANAVIAWQGGSVEVIA